MARRKAKPKRRSKYKGAFNIKNAAFAYAGISLASNSFLGVSPYTFLTAGFIPGSNASGWSAEGDPHTNMITLNEIIQGAQRPGSQGVTGFGEAVWNNTKSNLPMFVAGSIGLKVANKLVGSMGVSRNFNKVARALQMGNVVKM